MLVDLGFIRLSHTLCYCEGEIETFFILAEDTED